MNDTDAGRSLPTGTRGIRYRAAVRAVAVVAALYGCDVSDRDVGLKQHGSDASAMSDAPSSPPGTGGIKSGSGGGGALPGVGGAHGGSRSLDAGAGGARPDTADGSVGAGGDGTGGGAADGGADIGVGKLDEPCPENGALACAGHGQAERLVCRGGVWKSAGNCATDEYCDSSKGNAGACSPIVAECEGLTGGALFCRSGEKLACGKDLVTAESLGKCPFACSAGRCTGECVPGDKDCEGDGDAGAGLVPRACQPDGSWQVGKPCQYLCNPTTATCVAATCGDQALNGGETDVDCGGPCGASCKVNQKCATNADCAASACVSGKCTGVCSPGAKQCSGTGLVTCSNAGAWGTAVTPCAVPNGSPSCTAGACGIASCNQGYGDCDGKPANGCETNLNAPASCGTTCDTKTACASPSPFCYAGACTSDGPSCQGLKANCGPHADESCCASPLVKGDTFYRSYDGVTSTYKSQAYPATVSDFRLDRFEITVGRFRKFVAAYSQNMIPAGTGKNPHNASDPGWDTAWNANLPADAAALATSLQCSTNYATWTATATADDSRPINCLSWYEAFAFCIWDGGRLPTEAEWNFAAAGGTDQRVFPWGSTLPTSTNGLAAFGCYYNGSGSCSSVSNIARVGSFQNGAGRYGQMDLAGNVMELMRDGTNSTLIKYTPTSCTDCEDLQTPGNTEIRGGSFASQQAALYSSARYDLDVVGALGSRANMGARCARSP